MKIQEFCNFLSASPSPYHAVQNMVRKLEAKNFKRLRESGPEWNLTPGSRYYITRNNSSLIAFTIPNNFSNYNSEKCDVMIVGAHCDSPCLKLKVNSTRGVKEAFGQVAVETYGGGLWHTWFDRDLGVAGRILYKSGESVKERLVQVDRALFRIPSLAIHLDRGVSEGFKFNNELQLQPIYSLSDNSQSDSMMIPNDLKELLLPPEDNNKEDVIVGHDLCLYEVAPARTSGLREEFIVSGRLDNLFMSFCAIEGLLNSDISSKTLNIAAIFDNEEVGSQSPPGADSNFLPFVLDKICSTSLRSNRTFLVSADMAHAVHPNYGEKHDVGHRPRINGGLVLKHHSGCRYATTARASSAVRAFCQKYAVDVQDFMVRNDSPCGSTIGPMLAARLGVTTVDVGMAQLSMHSIREMAGSEDLQTAIRFLSLLYSNSHEIFDNLLILD